MYRDDKGGWVSAEEVKSGNIKVVGTDYRQLPIVHIGRGRPKTSMISLLKRDPRQPDGAASHHDDLSPAGTQFLFHVIGDHTLELSSPCNLLPNSRAVPVPLIARRKRQMGKKTTPTLIQSFVCILYSSIRII